MVKRLKVILLCIVALFTLSCSEEESPAEAAPADVTSEQAAPEGAEPPADVTSGANEGAENGEPPTGTPGKTAGGVVDDNPIPTEAECKKALIAMTEFAEKIGQKPPKKKERKEFLAQCEHWPRPAVQCLMGAQEAPAVLECMKPISRMEMKRSIEEAKKTVPSLRGGNGNKMLAPKKVKDRGGAAARRMESFKKAVGKD